MLRTLLICTLCLAGCGGSLSDKRRIEAIPAPYVTTDHENGLCGRVVSVDRDGRVWAERGCENGEVLLERTGRTVSAAERARVDAAFAALPASGCGADSAGVSVTLRRHDGAKESRWIACRGAALEAPWAEADAALAAVAPWPLTFP